MTITTKAGDRPHSALVRRDIALVVDDDEQVLRLVKRVLERAGFDCVTVNDGHHAHDAAVEWRPDIILLDLMIGDLTGDQIMAQLREDFRTRLIPVVFLTVRDSLKDKVEHLMSGADDYVTKPFSIQELLARVRAHLRRAPERTVDAPIEIGDFLIDAGAHTVAVGGKSLHLTPTEFDLLLFMARNAGKALTHRALLTAVWGGQSAHQPEYLRVFIGQLRRKLEAEGPRQYIQTEPWVGYRFVGPA